MAPWIEYPAEPKELLLVWQAPASVKDRLRWAVGRIWVEAGHVVFDYLQGEQFSELNLGRSEAALHACGFAGYPAFDRKRSPQGGFHEHVIDAFLRRLPPPSRSDFGDYLTRFQIHPKTSLSALALLAVTEARLPSDGFSLIDPLDATASRVDLTFEIADFRHIAAPDRTAGPGVPLQLEQEPGNRRDQTAVRVTAAGELVGYVNRLQAKTIGHWLRERFVACWLARVTGPHEGPRAYGFLQVHPATRSLAA